MSLVQVAPSSIGWLALRALRQAVQPGRHADRVGLGLPATRLERELGRAVDARKGLFLRVVDVLLERPTSFLEGPLAFLRRGQFGHPARQL